MSNKEVKVKVDIDSYKTKNKKKPETIGKVADGYTLKSIDYEPKKIDITGENKKDVNSIKLPAINIDNSSLSKTITYNLNDILENNLQVKKGNTDKILVTINIEKNN